MDRIFGEFNIHWVLSNLLLFIHFQQLLCNLQEMFMGSHLSLPDVANRATFDISISFSFYLHPYKAKSMKMGTTRMASQTSRRYCKISIKDLG